MSINYIEELNKKHEELKNVTETYNSYFKAKRDNALTKAVQWLKKKF